MQAGAFLPDMSPWPTDFPALHGVLRAAIGSLKEIDRDTFEALADKDTPGDYD